MCTSFKTLSENTKWLQGDFTYIIGPGCSMTAGGSSNSFYDPLKTHTVSESRIWKAVKRRIRVDKFNNILTVHHDKFYSKTIEMYFRKFYYLLFVTSTTCFVQASCSSSGRWFSLVLLSIYHDAGQYNIKFINAQQVKRTYKYKKTSWRWISSLFETCRGYYQNKIHESASRSFQYITKYSRFTFRLYVEILLDILRKTMQISLGILYCKAEIWN